MRHTTHGQGEDSLLAEIVTQAVIDIQILTAKGFIRNGKCAYTYESWPKTKRGYNKLILHHFNSPSDITALIDCFTKHQFDFILRFIDSTISSDKMLEAVMNEDTVNRVLAENKTKVWSE